MGEYGRVWESMGEYGSIVCGGGGRGKMRQTRLRYTTLRQAGVWLSTVCGLLRLRLLFLSGLHLPL